MAVRDWQVRIGAHEHHVRMDHGYWSGRLRVSIDGVEVASRPRNLLDFGSETQLTVGDTKLRLAIAVAGLRYVYTLFAGEVPIPSVQEPVPSKLFQQLAQSRAEVDALATRLGLRNASERPGSPFLLGFVNGRPLVLFRHLEFRTDSAAVHWIGVSRDVAHAQHGILERLKNRRNKSNAADEPSNMVVRQFLADGLGKINVDDLTQKVEAWLLTATALPTQLPMRCEGGYCEKNKRNPATWRCVNDIPILLCEECKNALLVDAKNDVHKVTQAAPVARISLITSLMFIAADLALRLGFGFMWHTGFIPALNFLATNAIALRAGFIRSVRTDLITTAFAIAASFIAAYLHDGLRGENSLRDFTRSLLPLALLVVLVLSQRAIDVISARMHKSNDFEILDF